MQKRYKPWMYTLLFLTLSLSIHAAPKDPPAPSVLQQVGTVKLLFDLNRVVTPLYVTNTNNPTTWRAYLPVCPPGTDYVSGVNPGLLQMDQGPNYPYCQCICLGICSGLTGITSPGGKIPIYTATATCSTHAQGWFDPATFTQNITPIHQYYYCQSGNCTTNPLPAQFNQAVPTGGYSNTIKIDFQACSIAAINGECSAPDPSSIGKQTAY